jgi:hypothetical protein
LSTRDKRRKEELQVLIPLFRPWLNQTTRELIVQRPSTLKIHPDIFSPFSTSRSSSPILITFRPLSPPSSLCRPQEHSKQSQSRPRAPDHIPERHRQRRLRTRRLASSAAGCSSFSTLAQQHFQISHQYLCSRTSAIPPVHLTRSPPSCPFSSLFPPRGRRRSCARRSE